MTIEIVKVGPLLHDGAPFALRAGDFVFLSGQTALEPEIGLPDSAKVHPKFPKRQSASRLQAEYVTRRVDDVLREVGSSLVDIVKAQAYFPDFKNFTAFDEVWRSKLENPPPRSSVGIASLIEDESVLQLDLLAYVPREGLRRELVTSDQPQPLANYSEAFRLGKWIFTAGQVASDFETGVPAQARPSEGLACYSSNIALQTEFVLNNLKKTLEQAGSSLDRVYKANVFLNDLADFYVFDEVWGKYFPDPPARTVINTSILAPKDTIIEIELYGYTAECGERHSVVTSAAPMPTARYAQACRFGEFIFVSSQLASDFRSGVAEQARVRPGFPFYGSDVKMQTAFILDNIEKTLQAAQSSLARVVKAQVFLRSNSDFAAFDEVWRTRFGQLPARTVLVTDRLLVEGARVEIEVTAVAV